MKNRLSFRPLNVAAVCLGLCFGTAAFAQTTAGTPNNAGKSMGGGEDQYPDIVELDPFGGVQTNGQVLRGLSTKLADGGVGGLRITYNPTKYLGFELWADFAQANVEFLTSSGVYPAGYGAAAGSPLPTYSFGARNFYFGLNPVLDLKPRGSRFQPYLTVGVNGIQFTPTNTAEALARDSYNQALFHSGNLNDNLQVGINYGGGIKWHFTDHFGLRIDARGFWSRNPTYDLPNYPDGGIYIPAKDKINSFQGTVGLVWFIGQGKCPPMPPAPAPPPPLATPTITGGEGTICQGKPVTLHANITSGHTLSYAWTLNGAPQQATGPDFTFTPNNTGSFNVQVTVTDTTPPPAPMERPKNIPVRCWVQPPTPPPPAPAVATVTLNVADTTPAINNVAASPNALTCQKDGGPTTAQLTASVAPSPCGGNVTYKWTVSEGSVTGDNTPNATFDASTLSFDPNSTTDQVKTITATVTVTDETGKTASQSTQITVTCKGNPVIRLDDVVFAKNNARVNNCGKRLLIDDAARRMASGDYDIILVGHRTADEERDVRGRRRGRGRREEAGQPLDEARTLNCAAVLSGGGGTCANVDRSRIRVDWVGTDQTSEPRPGQCVTSNIKERRGSTVTNADQNRRVEIYLVPRNSQNLPPAVKAIKPLPEREVRALGCPK